MLYVDSDGVCANFEQQVLDLFGATIKELGGDDVFWELANAHPDFWLKMKVMDGAHEFINSLKGVDFKICTGVAKSDVSRCSLHKRIWWKYNFGFEGDKIITCLSKDKWTFIQSPEDTIVDDTKRIIKKWAEHGGRAVHHRDFASTTTQLRMFGYDI